MAECGSEKKSLMAMKVAVVFASSGSEGLQGSGNTGEVQCTQFFLQHCSAVNFLTALQCSGQCSKQSYKTY